MKTVALPGPYHSQLFGLASPVSLDTGTTEVFLNDYFPEGILPDSFNCENLRIHLSKDAKKLIISAPLAQENEFIYSLTIYAKGVAYAIPVFGGIRKEIRLKTPDVDSHTIQTFVTGSFNEWNAQSAIPLNKVNDHWECTLSLKPGNYPYQLIRQGMKWISQGPDPGNPKQESNGIGGMNSMLEVPFPDKDSIPRLRTVSYTQDQIVFRSQIPLQKMFVVWQNSAIKIEEIAQGLYALSIPKEAQKYSRSWIRVFAASTSARGNELLIPLHYGKVLHHPNQLRRDDWEASVMYFPMIDRFNNGNTENDEPLSDENVLYKANYWGGDLQGVLHKIKDGYFEQLGINVLWLSPITQNPSGSWGQFLDPDTKFSGYHGYWPVSSTTIDHRFGNENILKSLLKEAHKRNINVILDYVANHVHKEHHIYQTHPEWATPLYLPDGSLNTERWDDHRLTTWFDTFLPSLDLEQQHISEFMTDSALYWVKDFEFDGFRHDATKHIPLNFWRSLNQKSKTQVGMRRNKRLYQIGETYGSHELIASYLGSGLLDGQFDFNMYDAALPVFSGINPDLTQLGLALSSSLTAYGHHHLMGNISGNQDKPRFMSYADGSLNPSTPWMEYKRIGWKKNIGIKDTTAYRKMELMHAWNMSIPGIPVIYYGDEIGIPGAGDPDNRRMMRFDSLNDQEMQLRKKVSELTFARKHWLPLIFGSTEIIYQKKNCMVVERTYFNEKVWMVLGTDADTMIINLKQDHVWNIKEIIDNGMEHIPAKNGHQFKINTPYSYAIIHFVKQD